MIYGIHGSKEKYVSDVAVNGFTRDSSACFIVPKNFQREELYKSVFLTLYFSISLSTLRKYESSNYTELHTFLQDNTEFIPTLMIFDLPHDVYNGKENVYEINYPGYLGDSLSYTKLKNNKKINQYSSMVTVDLNNEIRNIQCDYLYKLGSIDDPNERFFKKKNDFISYPSTGLNDITENEAARLCSYLEKKIRNSILEIINRGDKK